MSKVWSEKRYKIKELVVCNLKIIIYRTGKRNFIFPYFRNIITTPSFITLVRVYHTLLLVDTREGGPTLLRSRQ